MDAIVVEGVAPWDGRYEFDLADGSLTAREFGWIKRLTGTTAVGFWEGLTNGDPELFCVLAAIAMRRNGKIQTADVPAVYERLLDAPADSAVTFHGDREEAEPVEDPTASSSGNGGSSGPALTTSSETSVALPNASGTHGWDSSESPPQGSAS